jgi:hypothetical protein
LVFRDSGSSKLLALEYAMPPIGNDQILADSGTGILSHGTEFVMYQGARAPLRIGKNFQMPAIIADVGPNPQNAFFVFFTVPPLKKVPLGIQANCF